MNSVLHGLTRDQSSMKPLSRELVMGNVSHQQDSETSFFTCPLEFLRPSTRNARLKTYQKIIWNRRWYVKCFFFRIRIDLSLKWEMYQKMHTVRLHFLRNLFLTSKQTENSTMHLYRYLIPYCKKRPIALYSNNSKQEKTILTYWNHDIQNVHRSHKFLLTKFIARMTRTCIHTTADCQTNYIYVPKLFLSNLFHCLTVLLNIINTDR